MRKLFILFIVCFILSHTQLSCSAKSVNKTRVILSNVFTARTELQNYCSGTKFKLVDGFERGSYYYKKLVDTELSCGRIIRSVKDGGDND